MGDLFNINTSAKRFDANKVNILENGDYPYVVRIGSNNGQKGFLDEDTNFLNAGNTISFGQDTATMYYQEKPYFTGDKIKILYPKMNKFKKENAQFILTSMQLTFSQFAWGSSQFNTDVLNEQIIRLPQKNNEIDFDFMESFIAELEAERIAELEAYLSVSGLKDTHLTTEEEQILRDYENIEFSEYYIPDIFTVKNTHNILSNNIKADSGKTPYLGAGYGNNSVISYIAYNMDLIENGQCIFIGGKTFVVTYQQDNFFSNDSHNLALYVKDSKLKGKLCQLALVSCIYKGLKHKYSWGDSISNKKIQSDVIMLPTRNGQIDFDFMEKLISAVQKLVIADVVKCSDDKIKTTKEILI